MLLRVPTKRCLPAVVALCLAVAVGAAGQNGSPIDEPLRLHALIPLGAETFSIASPWKGTLTLIGSVEDPQFDGWTRLTQGRHHIIRAADGQVVRFYPENVRFRITATLRSRIGDPSPFPLTTSTPANDYLLGLRFRLAVFHGLHKTLLQPDAVDLIGVPADLQSDERIYRVSIALPHIPVEDRVVLEVLSPGGDRITKFHLDLI